MLRRTVKKKVVIRLIEEAFQEIIINIIIVLTILVILKNNKSNKRIRSENRHRYSMIMKIPDQVKYLNRMLKISDATCVDNYRMDRNAFGRLCRLLIDLGGLQDSKYVSVEEQVAMFISVIAHHRKNCTLKSEYWRSGQTVSHYVHKVLKAVLKLHSLFLVAPKPVCDDCTDTPWKWFKGCLGALDGTYVNVLVLNDAKPRYRSRKGEICTNVLAAVDRNLQFTYVLPGWEGSAADARVLRNAVARENGLKIPRGNYYLCDNGYANSEGFLTPYKCVRYHLNEWSQGSSRPQTYQELFNMRQSKARNIIERAFGIMHNRWGIFRSTTFYPIKVQIRLIMACFLLHNYIRTQMRIDPIELLLDLHPPPIEHDNHDDVLGTVDSSPESNIWRDELAKGMWNDFVGNHNA